MAHLWPALILTLLHACWSAPYQWTWLKGDKLQNRYVLFGQPGVPSAEAMPGARSPMTYCYDPNEEILVIFGGFGFIDVEYIGMMNDVWTYDVKTNQFTYYGGGTTMDHEGFYVDKARFSFESIPRSRNSAKLLCTLKNDSVYLYGGIAYFPQYYSDTSKDFGCNDLWQFNLKTRMWRWISGAIPGPDQVEVEPYRKIGYAAAYVEKENLWYIIDGYGDDSRNIVKEMWTFNPINETWTEEHLQFNDSMRRGVSFASTEYSTQRKHIYIFGGWLNSMNVRNATNEIWSYNTKTKSWNILYKHMEPNSVGIYKRLRFLEIDQYPSARGFAASALDEDRGLFFIFGGTFPNGISGSGTYLNDLWVYDSDMDLWIWLSGSKELDQPSYFGPYGVPSNINQPGSRSESCGFFSKSKNSFFVFGGAYNFQEISYAENQVWSFKMPERIFVFDTTTTSTSLELNTGSLTIGINRTPVTQVKVGDLEPTQINMTPYFILIVVFGFFIVIGCIIYNRRRIRSLHDGFTMYRSKSMQLMFRGATTSKSDENFGSSDYQKDSLHTTHTKFNDPTLFTANLGLAKPGYAELESKEYIMRKLITKGGGGQVYLGDAASERVGVYGKKVIIKFITDKYISLGELQRLAFDQEVATMMTLKDCPNIAKIIGYSDLPCVIVMKYYKDGSLVKWIHQKNLVRNERFYLAFDIAFGIYQLHKRDIAHCDLKPPNVLIETQNGMLRAYLTDFGIAQVVSTRILATNSFRLANLRGLSVRYASPEAFIRFRHRVEDTAEVVKAGDIYSYSMILFELLNKIYPWN